MTIRFGGKRIALFETRLQEELAALVRRLGGEPVSFPSLREVRGERAELEARVGALLDSLRGEGAPVVVFSTGVGATALFDIARSLGREKELRGVLSRGVAACRGPKPVAALHREGVVAQVKAASPYTTADLIEALDARPLDDRALVLLHYGERNHELSEALAARGARMTELLLYQWELPEDLAPLEAAVGQLLEGRFAAVAFTSQIQARHLLQVAGPRREALLECMRTRMVVAAVGPTCAKVLWSLGLPPAVVPESPRMGAMLTALAEHLAGAQEGEAA
jgi:uroporphyrinogen-III synthase